MYGRRRRPRDRDQRLVAFLVWLCAQCDADRRGPAGRSSRSQPAARATSRLLDPRRFCHVDRPPREDRRVAAARVRPRRDRRRRRRAAAVAAAGRRVGLVLVARRWWQAGTSPDRPGAGRPSSRQVWLLLLLLPLAALAFRRGWLLVVVLFVGSAGQKTLPWQMFTGLREQISPTILAVATILVVISIALLTSSYQSFKAARTDHVKSLRF